MSGLLQRLVLTVFRFLGQDGHSVACWGHRGIYFYLHFYIDWLHICHTYIIGALFEGCRSPKEVLLWPFKPRPERWVFTQWDMVGMCMVYIYRTFRLCFRVLYSYIDCLCWITINFTGHRILGSHSATVDDQPASRGRRYGLCPRGTQRKHSFGRILKGGHVGRLLIH